MSTMRSAALLANCVSSAAEAGQKPKRCGFLGINHAHALDALGVVRALPEYEVVGICEPDDSVREALARHPKVQGLPWLSMDDLLGDETVRMVAVESDVPRLLELGRTAVDAGKHIHLDKPAGTSLPEFKNLLDAAESQDLLVQMGYMFRYNPGFDLIRQAVAEGWLGDVYSIQASMCTSLSPVKRERIAFHPGGLMLELGCHLIDMIVLLLGPPNEVSSFLRHDGGVDDGLADNTLAVLEYDHAIVTVESAAMEPNAFAARRFKVCGPEGAIILSPLEPPAVHVSLRKGRGDFKGGVTETKLPDLDRHVRDFQDLARCIRGGAEFGYAKRHDLDVQRTVLRACGEKA
jgi:predicted dehydrogenase